MRVTVSASEPELLREVQGGELFLIHTPELCECVAARTLLADAEPSANESLAEVVIVGCRVGAGEVGHQQTGQLIDLSLDTPITRLEPIEPLALRARSQPVAAADAADWFPGVTLENAIRNFERAYETLLSHASPAPASRTTDPPSRL